MKFSWNLLNEFIDLKNIKFNSFQERLTLCGIEINEIKEDNEVQDKLIDLNFTANRKELLSIINLAKEISTIFHLPLKIKPKNSTINLKHEKNNRSVIEISKKILCFNLNFITNIKEIKSPQWLVNYLKACNVKPSNLFNDVQNYTYIKWGHEINILNTQNIEQQLLKLDIINAKLLLNNLDDKLFFNTTNSKILLFYTYNKNGISNKNGTLYSNHTEYFENAYNETINIIATYSKGTISKSYERCNKKEKEKHIVEINKSKIYNVLGKTENRPLKFMSTVSILNTLNILNFHPKYIRNLKKFKVDIPKYRFHDLKRDIDIIEEIGRIYGFQYFFNTLPLNKNKGRSSTSSLKIKKMRFLLRNLGFNEVINSSLIDNKRNKSAKILLHNPITKEQKALRNNIIENLLENYFHNIKHKNFRIEIFEIGKIFEKNTKNQYIEKTNVAGLICNNEFFRKEWSNKPESINWFQVKGIIEILLEQLNSEAILEKISTEDNKEYVKNINHLFHPVKKIGIYNLEKKQLIGILGELNIKHSTKPHNNNSRIYIFEINIDKLNSAEKTNKNSNFSIKKYSYYPSVTRDISVKIEKYKNVNEIKKIILETSIGLMESIEVFNEYYDKFSNSRFIGLRIIYRARSRTLNNEDIKNIDMNIKNLLNKIKTI